AEFSTSLLQSSGFLIFLCVLLLVKHLRDVLTNNMPPGPFPLPLVGNFINIGFSDPLEVWRCEHTIWETPCILLTGYESFKEAFVEQADIFTDRPYFPIVDKLSKGKGLIMSSGHMWRQQRRFALATLKYFGVGKKTLENFILQECRFLCDSIQTERGLPFDPQHFVTDAVANIICGLVFGHRCEYDDHNFHLMQKYLDEFLQLPISNWGRVRDQPAITRLIKRLTQKLRKLEERDPSNPRDYIDCYLEEIEKDSEAEFTEDNLMYCVVDLFGAGTETTSNTLRWALLFMIKYPESSREIDQVIGQTRQPLMDDQTNLPYTYAVMHEIQRFTNIVTFTPPRMANKDTTVGGRLIPKVILFLRHSILQDKNEYSTLYEFNPAHFLDENGKFLKKDSFIPFSIGKRMCPGEQLARMELFLFFTYLMQCFTFLPLEGQTLSLKGTISVSSGPEPFQIRAVSIV
uniref:Cytochrome P450, family 2, subfamily AE, polypeptide 1 n=1 Tax=Sinocyclocheilus anshuiensis TaxID=1608454 RepID=A0A671NC66_9TELE